MKIAKKHKKIVILNCVADTIYNFLWYDRRDDDIVSQGFIEECLKNGDICISDITEEFSKILNERLKPYEKVN